MKPSDFPLKTLAAEWETYIASCGLKNPSPLQLAEMKRSFYGGALVCFNHLKFGRALESVQAELEAFCDLIAAGKA